MKRIFLLGLFSTGLFGQASGELKLITDFQVPSKLESLPQAHWVAAEMLFTGYRTVFNQTLPKRFNGVLEKRHVIKVVLRQRAQVTDEQLVVVYAGEAGKIQKEVYRFALSLQSDLQTEAIAGVDKALELIKPMPVQPKKAGLDRQHERHRASEVPF